jgi:hypothetical protein
MSICMWVSEGSVGRARNGGWIHIHNDIPFTPSAITTPRFAKPKTQVAPIEVRDAIYRELIRISPATRYRKELIDGPNGLLARGLSIRDTLNYGALPASQHKRAALAKSLRSFAKARFSQYADLAGIPGFWQNVRGLSQIWTRHDFNGPMLVIPYKDECGRIQACQIRLHPDDITPDNPKKYRWLSSPDKPFGSSSGTPIHFTFDPQSLPPGADVILTEGGLKADTVASLRPTAHLIATSGVSCSHGLLISAARPYNALIGFDSDYRTNPAVCAQLASLIAARQLDLRKHDPDNSRTTRILFWEDQKGIDDAVRLKAPISIISINEWLASLSVDVQSAVLEIWRDMGYAKNRTVNGDSTHETASPTNPNLGHSLDPSYRCNHSTGANTLGASQR